jgi:hypothetical protein
MKGALAFFLVIASAQVQRTLSDNEFGRCWVLVDIATASAECRGTPLWFGWDAKASCLDILVALKKAAEVGDLHLKSVCSVLNEQMKNLVLIYDSVPIHGFHN